MTTPPSRLLAKLHDFDLIDVRSIDGKLEDQVTLSGAMSLAISGRFEGVGPASGRIRYLRRLPESAMQSMDEMDAPKEVYRSGSSVVARTNLGVYRQEIESAMMDDFGAPTRIVIGHQFAFCALRAAGI